MIRLLALLLVFLVPAALAQAETQGARVMLVLDASGSMYGQIDGRAKIDIAKEVVGQVIGKWRPGDELGLVVYGHRRKGACDDIEVLNEPGPLDARAFLDTVNAINPKGKTPMTAAVKIAAESLRYTEQKSTVILVSDGLETCDLDPCSIASDLERQGVDFTMHTVGFNIDDPKARDQLKCLAENTGGLAVYAENALELANALQSTVAAATEEPPPAPEPEKEPEPPPAPEYNVTGHAILAEGQELYAPFADAVWEIYRMAADGTPADRIDTKYGLDFAYNLEPGQYIVEVSANKARRRFPLEVAAGKPYTIYANLNATVFKLKGAYDAETDVTADNATWEIRSPQGLYLDTLYGAAPQVLLNDGTYVFKLILGDASAEASASGKPGEAVPVVVTLGAGVVEASAEFAKGGPPVEAGMAFEVRQGEAGPDGEYKWINTQYNALSRFNLPAGKYQVVCTLDYAKGETFVEVRAGGTAKALVTLDAGYLAMPAGEGYVYEVYSAKKDISGKRKWISTDYGSLNKAYNAGEYYVVVKDGQGEAIHEKTYTVTAGERTEGTLP